MKVLVIGSGGREHAICTKFAESPQLTELFCAEGNAGIAEIAEIVDVKSTDVTGLVDFAVSRKIDLTFVGSETPLALGIADEFEKQNLKIVGVSKSAARLEASKSFSKEFMRRHKIPTAAFQTAHSTAEAIEILEGGEFGGEELPIVVKADGLAAGKGVIVARNRAEAVAGIKSLSGSVGAEAAAKIVLEECLTGREVSLLLFTDGENYALMPPARDHKRIGENDTGANTGGMGTITDDALLSEAQRAEIIENIVEPTLRAAKSEGFPIRGILFIGLMLTPNGVKVLEYNVRFGDPETQSILIRLKTDFLDICQSLIGGTLNARDIEWRSGNSACVILAAKNYPQKPQSGDVISGLERAAHHKKTMIFHAGTRRTANGEIVTAGGRVLGVTAAAKTLEKALERAYAAVGDIEFVGMQFRRDIGK